MVKSYITFLVCLVFTTASGLPSHGKCDFSKRVLGGVESIKLENKYHLEAKLDTGASMSSLSAIHIKIIDKKRKWVQFSVPIQGMANSVVITRPLIGYVTIQKRSDECEGELNGKFKSKRPIVELNIQLGNNHYLIKANLINRKHFKYPLLLGVNAIQKLNALVDVSQDHLAE